ncbi:hypothetical protein NA57DRAFT_72943 [Rhizodiscina lignyota]|uniref:Uncharacterized protein n=1 Tax=Rhizodiscina lignyota TaxID=1504668 RepID=A0A9P4M8D5_9PEZI|nr:hypothetical protein NA57DRAFT_72943 [Rhizodiscina lignyota]
MDLLPLPTLTDEPTKHYGSCTFLSIGLIQAMSLIISEAPGITASIGSGLALLEALLSHTTSECHLECVEVASFRNERKYLPEDKMHYVQGTWQVSSCARTARAWMFIFPRDLQLVEKYVAAYGDDSVELILWIGPRDDFPEYENIVKHEKFNCEGEFGQGVLQQNEMGWLWRHKHVTSNTGGPCQLQSCPDINRGKANSSVDPLELELI